MASQSSQKERSFVRRHAGKLILGAAVAGGYYAYTNYGHLFSVDYWLPDEFRRLKTVLEEQAIYADRQCAPLNHDTGKASRSAPARSVPPAAKGGETAPANDLHGRLHDMLAKVIALVSSKLAVSLDSDELRRELRTCSADVNAKLALWDQLRHNSWTKCIVAVYVLSHSVLLLSVKLAIAVRYIRIQKQLASTIPAPTALPAHPQLLGNEQALQAALIRYLDSIDFVIGKGLENLIAAVRECVTRFTTPIGLGEPVDKSTLTSVFYETRKLVENKLCAAQKAAAFSTVDADGDCSSPNQSIMQTNYHIDFVLSSSDNKIPRSATNSHRVDHHEEALIKELHRETVEVLRSMECNMVLACLLESAFKYAVDELAEFIAAGHTSSSSSLVTSDEPKTDVPEGSSIPHAKLLPALEKIAGRIFSSPDATTSLSNTLLNLSYLSLFDQRVQAGQVVAVSNTFPDPRLRTTAVRRALKL